MSQVAFYLTNMQAFHMKVHKGKEMETSHTQQKNVYKNIEMCIYTFILLMLHNFKFIYFFFMES